MDTKKMSAQEIFEALEAGLNGREFTTVYPEPKKCECGAVIVGGLVKHNPGCACLPDVN